MAKRRGSRVKLGSDPTCTRNHFRQVLLCEEGNRTNCYLGCGEGQLRRCCQGIPPGCRSQSGELPGLLSRHDQDRGEGQSGHGDRVTGTTWGGGDRGKEVKGMEGGRRWKARKEMT